MCHANEIGISVSGLPSVSVMLSKCQIVQKLYDTQFVENYLKTFVRANDIEFIADEIQEIYLIVLQTDEMRLQQMFEKDGINGVRAGKIFRRICAENACRGYGRNDTQRISTQFSILCLQACRTRNTTKEETQQPEARPPRQTESNKTTKQRRWILGQMTKRKMEYKPVTPNYQPQTAVQRAKALLGKNKQGQQAIDISQMSDAELDEMMNNVEVEGGAE